MFVRLLTLRNLSAVLLAVGFICCSAPASHALYYHRDSAQQINQHGWTGSFGSQPQQNSELPLTSLHDSSREQGPAGNQGLLPDSAKNTIPGQNHSLDTVMTATGSTTQPGSGTIRDEAAKTDKQSRTEAEATGEISDKLGRFEDPMQFFCDAKTRRKKSGLRAEQKTGMLTTIGLIYDSKGEQKSREQGLAGRFTYGHERKWMVGGSYTLRRAVDAANGEGEQPDNVHATAFDVQLPLLNTLEVVFEAASTKDPQNNEARGYLLRGKYDLGRIRVSGGYIDLGEHFDASYADPLHQVNHDAGGLETSVDYLMAQPFWKISRLKTTVHYFKLTRHSNDEQIEEMNGSLHLGLGKTDTFLFRFFNREDGPGSNRSVLGNLTHGWNEEWSSRIQSNYLETDSGHTLRVSVATGLKQASNSSRLSIDWMRRESDAFPLSLYEERRIRFDMKGELWRLQLQGKLSKDSEDLGTSFYGRLEYKPAALRRYQTVGYAAIGKQAGFDFDQRFELGMKLTF